MRCHLGTHGLYRVKLWELAGTGSLSAEPQITERESRARCMGAVSGWAVPGHAMGRPPAAHVSFTATATRAQSGTAHKLVCCAATRTLGGTTVASHAHRPRHTGPGVAVGPGHAPRLDAGSRMRTATESRTRDRDTHARRDPCTVVHCYGTLVYMW